MLCSVIDQPDESKEMKLCLALNRIEGRWDTDRLGELLRDDEVLEFETGFDRDEVLVYRQLGGDGEGEDADDDPDWDQDEDPDAEDADGEEEDEPAGGDDEPAMGTTVDRIGHLHFKVEVPRYKRLVESIRDAGIFDQGEIAQEMKRRLLRHD